MNGKYVHRCSAPHITVRLPLSSPFPRRHSLHSSLPLLYWISDVLTRHPTLTHRLFLEQKHESPVPTVAFRENYVVIVQCKRLLAQCVRINNTRLMQFSVSARGRSPPGSECSTGSAFYTIIKTPQCGFSLDNKNSIDVKNLFCAFDCARIYPNRYSGDTTGCLFSQIIFYSAWIGALHLSVEPRRSSYYLRTSHP